MDYVYDIINRSSGYWLRYNLQENRTSFEVKKQQTNNNYNGNKTIVSIGISYLRKASKGLIWLTIYHLTLSSIYMFKIG